MAGFEGFENAGLVKGPQEKATEKFITEYRHGKEDNPMADFIYSSMLSIARNIDVQNSRGREISRNMTSLLGYIQQLETMYEGVDDDQELSDLLQEAAR
ncbi:hypothetical protein [Bifidobacterium imperatoris]|nr:hypothetical protein [Bifidobacterium imperatoris]PLS24348.1 hypothetical protein Tam1G_1611 [Bifidobacterium imperatoris]